jgi:NAD(P)-dependent dehydrogenase (short-subunit alcohol dehydrogenase family)
MVKENFMRLKNKIAIITGAGTGLGEATALLFAKEGAHVMLMGRRKEKIDAVAEKIKKDNSNSQVLAFPGDVSINKNCETVISETMKKWGRIDILVNNAGIGLGQLIHETTEEDWDIVFDINMKGLFLMTKAVLPAMLKQKYGSIVNISSILGLVGSHKASAAYQASKGGVISFSKSTAIAYAQNGIRCNCICPAVVETELNSKMLTTPDARERLNRMHPIGRMGQPIDVAYAILFLSSDEASWITGSILPVDGGFTAQ